MAILNNNQLQTSDMFGVTWMYGQNGDTVGEQAFDRAVVLCQVAQYLKQKNFFIKGFKFGLENIEL